MWSSAVVRDTTLRQTDTYPVTRYRRYLSLAIIMFTMLISSMGFSSVFGSIWQYYEKIDDSASESFLGVIIAAYSLGSLLTAPLFGVWSNYRPVSEPLIFSMILYCSGNLLYVYAESFTNSEKWILLTSRFIVGSGSANIVALRSYCSAATWENERTTVMSFLSAMQALGFVLGPALGLLFQPLGDDGVEWEAIDLHFNLYTGPGFLAVFLCSINIILIIFFFQEFDVHGSKTKKSLIELCICCQSNSQQSERKPLLKKSDDQQQRYDKIAACVCIILLFIVQSVFAAVETLMAPLAKEQYAWSSKDATLYVNIISAGTAILCVMGFIATKYIVQWIQERLLLITWLLMIICGFLVLMPYGPGHPDVEMSGLTNSSDGKLIGDNPELGCNFHKHSWCLHQPKIYLPQCVIGICVITVAYSSSLLLCPTIFSKVLGPWPQGLMMSCLTISGNVARVVGPLFLAKVYSEEGPQLTFIVLICFVFFGVLMMVAFYRRMVPHSVYEATLESVSRKECSPSNHVNVNGDQSSDNTTTTRI